MSDDSPRSPAGSATDAVDADLEITQSHHAHVGHIDVRRALPRRGRRSIGAWCFADHMGPADVDEQSGLDIGPHPHIGLQTVTWLIEGQALHRDSLGSEQVIAPRQLNLMTAGHGVAHAEEATGHFRGSLQGIQLWIALPDATRMRSATFEHHSSLPESDLANGAATVFMGDFNGLSSPARCDTELVGVDLDLRGVVHLPLREDFEYGLVALEGSLEVNGVTLAPGQLGYLRRGRDEIELGATHVTRAILIGGTPLEQPPIMWWNFVARSRGEIDEAHDSWTARDDRFGRVASALDRIEAPTPYWR